MRWYGYHFEPEDRPSPSELAAEYQADLRDAEDQREAQRIADLYLPSWRIEYVFTAADGFQYVYAFDEDADDLNDEMDDIDWAAYAVGPEFTEWGVWWT